MRKSIFLSACILFFCPLLTVAQLQWQNVDSVYQPLPATVHVFKTNSLLDGKPNIAYYLIADLKDKSLSFTTQVGKGKRYTPSQYYEQEQHPLVVMNSTFFEFVHNSNLNVIIKDGNLLAQQHNVVAGRGKDTLTYRHVLVGAIGISKKRKADVAWVYTDSALPVAYAVQNPVKPFKDSLAYYHLSDMQGILTKNAGARLKKWKMQTATGGGPVLLQHGEIQISNNEELKFAGKAIDDKHPRTAMGYTADNKLILLVIEGRFPGKAEGATLAQQAQMLKDLGCVEAINLDGGGSSCLLINGKQTITPSDKEGQRPVPGVFIVKN
jgi:hypothetical protein